MIFASTESIWGVVRVYLFSFASDKILLCDSLRCPHKVNLVSIKLSRFPFPDELFSCSKKIYKLIVVYENVA